MLKKWQPGNPCSHNEYVAGFTGKCVKLVLDGIVDGTCDCCTDFNGHEFFFPITYTDTWASGSGRQCTFTGGGWGGGGSTDANCDCFGGLASQFGDLFLWTEIDCKLAALQVLFAAGGTPSSGNAFEILAGWNQDYAADHDDVEDALKALCRGEVVDMPVRETASSGACDLTNVTISAQLVDGSNCVGAPSKDPDPCDSITNPADCADPAPANLVIDLFEDCVSIGDITSHWTYSNLNGSYEVDFYGFGDQVFSPPFPCDVIGGLPGTLLYYQALGTANDFNDAGILIRRDEFPDPLIGREEYVLGILFFAECANDTLQFGNPFALACQEFDEVLDGGGNVVEWALSPRGVFCVQIVKVEGSDLRVPVRACNGLGSISARYLYDLCGANGEFSLLTNISSRIQT